MSLIIHLNMTKCKECNREKIQRDDDGTCTGCGEDWDDGTHCEHGICPTSPFPECSCDYDRLTIFGACFYCCMETVKWNMFHTEIDREYLLEEYEKIYQLGQSDAKQGKILKFPAFPKGDERHSIKTEYLRGFKSVKNPNSNFWSEWTDREWKSFATALIPHLKNN